MAWELPALHPNAVVDLAAAPRRPPDELAYERGVADGWRAGREEGEAAVRGSIQTLRGVIDALESERGDFHARLVDNLVAVALAVARHLVERELATDPGIVRDLVRRAAEFIPDRELLTIRLHPDDLAIVSAHWPSPADGARAVEFSADAMLSRGSTVLETPRYLVDGDLEAALARLYERLKGA
jgi:flagellar assembly protein FliH